MLYKTRGIVFRFTRFGETSIIVTIFTELFGLQTYIVNGARSKSAKSKMALYQPLTLLDLVVYHRENASILRIKELKCAHPYSSFMVDVKKTTLGVFLNEVINKAIKEESHAQELCSFLFNSFLSLDAMERNYENFHLIFLVKLSRYLGFGVHSTREIFDSLLLDNEDERLLQQLLESEYDSIIEMTNTQRRNLLDVLLRFYALHSENFGEMKSVAVLREVLG